MSMINEDGRWKEQVYNLLSANDRTTISNMVERLIRAGFNPREVCLLLTEEVTAATLDKILSWEEDNKERIT